MPHIIIEYSSDISSQAVSNLESSILEVVANTSGGFDPDQCKLRAFSFNDYFVGHKDQQSASFIHLTFKLLTGRSIEVRQALSQNLANLVEAFIKEHKLTSARCDISVDIVEMNRDTYYKSRIE